MRPNESRSPSLSEITVHPLKGARGFNPDSWSVVADGLAWDRRLMLVDANGDCATQLRHRSVAQLETEIRGDDLELRAPGRSPITRPLESFSAGDATVVRMEEGEEVPARFVDATLDVWLSEVLEFDCRLVAAGSDTTRWADGREDLGGRMTFQKSFPLHLVAQASLDDLNDRLDAPVRINRFRPNLVVSGTRPHEDDEWLRIAIGGAVLRIERACDHACGVVNVEQETGARSVEPLKTIRTYRRMEKALYFGQNVVVESPGELRVGDPVIVLERGEGLTKRRSVTSEAPG